MTSVARFSGSGLPAFRFQDSGFLSLTGFRVSIVDRALWDNMNAGMSFLARDKLTFCNHMLRLSVVSCCLVMSCSFPYSTVGIC